MAEPKTRLSDYQKYREEADPLENRLATGTITSEEFLKQEAELRKRYEGRVFPEDTYFFDTYSEFARFMIRELGFASISEVIGMISNLRHELQHGKKAEEKGMICRYGCTLLINDVTGKTPDDRSFSPFVMLIRPDTRDAKKVLEAADEPSERDKELGDLL